MKLYTNVDTIGNETNLQVDTVIALSKEEADRIYFALCMYIAKGTSQQTVEIARELATKLCEVL